MAELPSLPNFMAFQKGEAWRGNRNGRPKTGQSFAEKVRAAVGDGEKLIDVWLALAVGRLPKLDTSQSSNALYVTYMQQLQREASVRDRIQCSQLLAERGFGKPKEQIEHSGSINLPTAVIHEYHSS